MPTTRLPSTTGWSLQDAGVDWDAIRVPRSVGASAVAILGTRCGAVVEDSMNGAVYFFTPVGTAEVWTVDTTRALGAGSAVTIPPTRRVQGPGAFWLMCPGEDRWLTDPAALTAALADACAPRRDTEGAG
ncbi:hypothetical protein ACIRQH_35210 [Streptomyces sp. NPDC102279]|uniref:hypothetical protein n=1 Tax=Streptomyces sp. NPDC102279 TaxID=3366153 RepID=UPI0037F5167B